MGKKVPLEKEMAPHSSILAWEIPWTEKPGGLQSMGLQESDTTEPLNQTTMVTWSKVSFRATFDRVATATVSLNKNHTFSVLPRDIHRNKDFNKMQGSLGDCLLP